LQHKAPICIEGQGGDRILFEVVQYGAYDLALPVRDVLKLIEEHYDHRCIPPWGDELERRVIHKAIDAKTRSTRPRQVPLTEFEEWLYNNILSKPKSLGLDLPRFTSPSVGGSKTPVTRTSSVPKYPT